MSVKFTESLKKAILKIAKERLVITEGENGKHEISEVDAFISTLEDYMSPVSPLDHVSKFSNKSIRECIEIAKEINARIGFIDPDDYEWVFHKR
jgi:hypothetical protein